MHGYRILGGRIPYISYIRAFFQKLAVFSLQLFDFQLFESKTHVVINKFKMKKILVAFLFFLFIVLILQAQGETKDSTYILLKNGNGRAMHIGRHGSSNRVIHFPWASF